MSQEKQRSLLQRTVMFAAVTILLSSSLVEALPTSAAPKSAAAPVTTAAATTTTTTTKVNNGTDLSTGRQAGGFDSKAVIVAAETQQVASPLRFVNAVEHPQKLKRDTKAKVTELELDTQETGYLPSAYHAADQDYAYDAGKNSYGKQASDWSLYDQGNHGVHDKYGDKAWSDQGHNAHNAHGKHDSYGNSYNAHGANHGSGYYSRDRGYGYEKHYAYDKEIASKHHADSHNNYGSQHGLHDHYGNAASQSHAHNGHDKYGQLSRYGNHGYGKQGSHLAAHQDYGHNVNKGHYYTQNTPQTYHSYSSHVPTYRSTHSDYYSPHASGYPSSYPSYY